MTCQQAALAVIATSCGGVSAQDQIKCISSTNPLVDSLSYFPPSMRITGDGFPAGAADVTIASGFSVHYDNYFKVVKTICGPHQPAGCKDKTYVLTLCGADKPTKYANGTALSPDVIHFTVPLTAVATTKSGPVPFLELLGLLNKVEVVDPNYIHSPCLQNLEQNGNITGSKQSDTANFKKLIADHPRVTGVFTDSWGTGKSNTSKDIIFDGSADSAGVLGRAEWIKFMSLFFNDEDKANLYFSREQTAYKSTEEKVKAAKSTTAKTCAWVSKSWSTGKYVVKFTKYQTDLCKSAGLTPYVNDTLLNAKTYKQEFATTADFHEFLHKQDVVIDLTYYWDPTTANKAAVLKKFNITGLNKAGAMLLRTDAHMSDTKSKLHGSSTGSALDWLESAIARPALVLQDLASMVWGNDKIAAPPAGCAQYFRNVLKDEMPDVNTHESCEKFAAAEKEGKCITNAIKPTEVDRSYLSSGAMSASSTAIVSTILATIFAVLTIF